MSIDYSNSNSDSSLTNCYTDILNTSNVEVNVDSSPGVFEVYAEPLPPERTRWFYLKNLKSWKPFCGYDSLRLETKWRELLRTNRIYKVNNPEKILVRGDLYEVDVFNRIGTPIYWTETEECDRSFKIIRGTWFKKNTLHPLISEDLAGEIEEEHMKLFGEPAPIHRLFRHQGNIIQHQLKKLHILAHNITVNDYHIEWYGQDATFCYQDSTSQFFRSKLGFGKIGNRIIRGYPILAEIEDKVPDIGHIVFVIHGIGQKIKGGDIVVQTNKMRSLCRKIGEKHYPWFYHSNTYHSDESHDEYIDEGKVNIPSPGSDQSKLKSASSTHTTASRSTTRIEFLPIEWRKCLKLNDEMIEMITPNVNRSIRNVLNASALDILYYSSPIYRREMVESLRMEMTRVYSMFCSRSPYFEARGGRVSVCAHSLGSVLLYDILSDWNPAKLYQNMESFCSFSLKDLIKKSLYKKRCQLDDAREKVQQLEIQYLKECEKLNYKSKKLPFRLDCMFCVGSPLPAYLIMRGVKANNKFWTDNVLDKKICQRFFNVFHPADPLVYRIEPLISRAFADIEPVRIFRQNEIIKYSEETDISLGSKKHKKVLTFQPFDYDTHHKNKKRRGSSVIQGTSNGMFGRLTSYLSNWRYGNDFHMNGERTSGSTQSSSDELLNFNSVHSGGSSNLNNEESQADQLTSANKRKYFPPCTRVRTMSLISSFRKCRHTITTHRSRYRHNSISTDIRSLDEEYLRQLFNETKESQSTDQSITNHHDNCSRSNSTKLMPDSPSANNQTSDANLQKLAQQRLDYILPMGRYEVNLISYLTAHTSYWTNPELCLFMLSHLFGESDSK